MTDATETPPAGFQVRQGARWPSPLPVSACPQARPARARNAHTTVTPFAPAFSARAQPCAEFSGARPGHAFKAGPLGVGYYADEVCGARAFVALVAACALASRLGSAAAAAAAAARSADT